MTRVGVLVFLAMCVASLSAAGEKDMDDLIVVAHRGVVEDGLTENSLASLEETIRRGYTHIEVDICPTKDGRAVCLHDRSLKRIAGVRRFIDEVTLAELRELVPEERVPSLATFAKRCAGRIALMPDVKRCPPAVMDAFVADIESALTENGLMENALFIGRLDVGKRFEGRARLAWRVPLKVAQEKRDMPRESVFIFNEAADFTQEDVKGFQELGLTVVVSVNTQHYPDKETGAQGREDIVRLLEWGVDGIQIDSIYDDLVFAPEPKTEN
ncbi:MAG: hypothetical protein GWP08_08320 [Nitrospiraceae bacterium]|nr:hypothetical protein [Nitrospiraceae bacterium]